MQCCISLYATGQYHTHGSRDVVSNDCLRRRQYGTLRSWSSYEVYDRDWSDVGVEIARKTRLSVEISKRGRIRVYEH